MRKTILIFILFTTNFASISLSTEPQFIAPKSSFKKNIKALKKTATWMSLFLLLTNCNFLAPETNLEDTKESEVKEWELPESNYSLWNFSKGHEGRLIFGSQLIQFKPKSTYINPIVMFYFENTDNLPDSVRVLHGSTTDNDPFLPDSLLDFYKILDSSITVNVSGQVLEDKNKNPILSISTIESKEPINLLGTISKDFFETKKLTVGRKKLELVINDQGIKNTLNNLGAVLKKFDLSNYTIELQGIYKGYFLNSPFNVEIIPDSFWIEKINTNLLDWLNNKNNLIIQVEEYINKLKNDPSIFQTVLSNLSKNNNRISKSKLEKALINFEPNKVIKKYLDIYLFDKSKKLNINFKDIVYIILEDEIINSKNLSKISLHTSAINPKSIFKKHKKRPTLKLKNWLLILSLLSPNIGKAASNKMDINKNLLKNNTKVPDQDEYILNFINLVNDWTSYLSKEDESHLRSILKKEYYDAYNNPLLQLIVDRSYQLQNTSIHKIHEIDHLLDKIYMLAYKLNDPIFDRLLKPIMNGFLHFIDLSKLLDIEDKREVEKFSNKYFQLDLPKCITGESLDYSRIKLMKKLLPNYFDTPRIVYPLTKLSKHPSDWHENYNEQYYIPKQILKDFCKNRINYYRRIGFNNMTSSDKENFLELSKSIRNIAGYTIIPFANGKHFVEIIHPKENVESFYKNIQTYYNHLSPPFQKAFRSLKAIYVGENYVSKGTKAEYYSDIKSISIKSLENTKTDETVENFEAILHECSHLYADVKNFQLSTQILKHRLKGSYGRTDPKRSDKIKEEIDQLIDKGISKDEATVFVKSKDKNQYGNKNQNECDAVVGEHFFSNTFALIMKSSEQYHSNKLSHIGYSIQDYLTNSVYKNKVRFYQYNFIDKEIQFKTIEGEVKGYATNDYGNKFVSVIYFPELNSTVHLLGDHYYGIHRGEKPLKDENGLISVNDLEMNTKLSHSVHLKGSNLLLQNEKLLDNNEIPYIQVTKYDILGRKQPGRGYFNKNDYNNHLNRQSSGYQIRYVSELSHTKKRKIKQNSEINIWFEALGDENLSDLDNITEELEKETSHPLNDLSEEKSLKKSA